MFWAFWNVKHMRGEIYPNPIIADICYQKIQQP